MEKRVLWKRLKKVKMTKWKRLKKSQQREINKKLSALLLNKLSINWRFSMKVRR
jgi:hypothetical protein